MASDVKKTVAAGDAVAQSMGYNSAANLVATVNDNLASTDEITQRTARNNATDFVNKLTQLVLYQQIDGEYNFDAYRYVNKFENTKIAAGNSKQYQRKILTGSTTYNPNEFVPTTTTYPTGDVATISLYGTDGNLSTYGYQFKKGVSLQPQKWMTYFTSGKLQEFLTDTVNSLNQSYYLFRVSMVEKMIKDMKPTRTVASGGNYTLSNNKIQKNIVGTASNLLTAFTQEIFPEIQKMRFLTSEYNINLNGTSTSLNSTSKNKLILLMNTNTATKLQNGVIANVFNAQLVKPDNFIDSENIFQVSKMLNFSTSDETAPVTIQETNLLEEDEIIVLESDAIKSLYWIPGDEEANRFGQNMTTQVTLHAWGALGFIPWGMGFYYTNKNMSNLPTA